MFSYLDRLPGFELFTDFYVIQYKNLRIWISSQINSQQTGQTGRFSGSAHRHRLKNVFVLSLKMEKETPTYRLRSMSAMLNRVNSLSGVNLGPPLLVRRRARRRPQNCPEMSRVRVVKKCPPREPASCWI
jgi:hypothetical protein